MHLLHTRLLVKNFPECFRFYRDAMQFKPFWGDENDSYASFKQGDEDAIVLALFNRQAMAEAIGTGDLPPDAQSQDRFVLIFTVTEIEPVVRNLKDKGIQLDVEPKNFPDWGIRCAYLRDPDGNLIELSSELPKESWSDGLRQADEKWHPSDGG